MSYYIFDLVHAPELFMTNIARRNIQINRSFNSANRTENYLDETLIGGRINGYHRRNGTKLLLDQVWIVVDKVFVLSNFVNSWNDRGLPTQIHKTKMGKVQYTSGNPRNIVQQYQVFPAINFSWYPEDDLL
jgi:hypothetical protein